MQDYDPNSTTAMAGAIALIGVLFIPFLIISIISIIGQWKVYTKAGKPGWACIIPIYNLIVLLEIAGKPIWWIFLFLIPCVNIIFIVWTINLVSKSFGQSEGFTVGLLLLGFIFWPILGFGNYQYLGPAAAEAGGLNRAANNYQDPSNPPQS
jgi:hypothetical protein